MKVNGDLSLKDFSLTGENGEYAIGPVNGVIPIVYSNSNVHLRPDLARYRRTPVKKRSSNCHRLHSLNSAI